jgi:hypothetical protein
VTTVEIIGVYLVDAPESCHLVELVLRENGVPVDVGQFTQPVADRPADEWQVPYGEKLLDPDGVTVTWDLWDGPGDHDLWNGDVRMAFFVSCFGWLDTPRDRCRSRAAHHVVADLAWESQVRGALDPGGRDSAESLGRSLWARNSSWRSMEVTASWVTDRKSVV